MSKIKLTKGESKRQRDALSRFSRYLPTLQLKKQQLQLKIREVRLAFKLAEARAMALETSVRHWSGLLGEKGVDLSAFVFPSRIVVNRQNIAGTAIPVLVEVVFPSVEYDFYELPVWMDRAVDVLRDFMKAVCEKAVLDEQRRSLEHELRVTFQRVNLFEKVKIPECQENIRIIRIYLGDQQANAVGISKVAKKKLESLSA